MTATVVPVFADLGAQLAQTRARFADLGAQLAQVGRVMAAELADYRTQRRATWEANREAVHQRRATSLEALAMTNQRRLDDLYVTALEAAGEPPSRRHRRLGLESPTPPPLYVASLVRASNAPPRLIASAPMGETT